MRARWQEIQRFVLEFKATPDLVCCFFELVSYSFKQKASNIWIQEKLAGFEFQHKSFNFPPYCPDYPWYNYEREILYSLSTDVPPIAYGL